MRCLNKYSDGSRVDLTLPSKLLNDPKQGCVCVREKNKYYIYIKIIHTKNEGEEKTTIVDRYIKQVDIYI